MLARLRNRNGSRYTLISIVLIIIMLYFFRYALGSQNVQYPQTIYFEGQKYIYSQTVNQSSLKFIRSYGKNYNGFVILTKRGENSVGIPDRVYIFEGWKKYRQYEIVR